VRIVVLDGHTLNPGDLSWDELRTLGDCIVHERTPASAILERAAGAAAVLTNKTPLNADTLRSLPGLRYIGVLATGHNVVDAAAARSLGIVVSNVPAYGTQSVAQMVFGHLLDHALHVADHAKAVSSGEWSRCRDFAFFISPLIELSGLTMGILGFGRIGAATARAGRSFGMRIIAHDLEPESVRLDGFEPVALGELFRRSDVLSLHCPLTEATRAIVNETRLRMMKPTAFLINTSRGGLVDEPALARALNEEWIAGAGLDVLGDEPPPPDHPLLRAKNCRITPHIAWATRAARERLMSEVVENLRAFMAGIPRNVVNPPQPGPEESQGSSVAGARKAGISGSAQPRTWPWPQE
jgi:glycerate dehydrogenase